ncbi:TIGR00266 family protein [Myxococcota bacterium]|nr:TIGR00266 family protein [Myxococcota bacterium]
MDFELMYRPTQSIARCRLHAGETVLAESGAMLGMSSGVSVETTAGGAKNALKRLFGGETAFRNRFTAQSDAEVLLAPPLRGDLAVLDVGASQYVVQRGAFVASSPTVDVKTRASVKGFFSGMGLLLLETTGSGQLLVGSFGAMEAIDVDGELVVDTGHLVAWEQSIPHEITKASAGWVGSFFSGEGFVVRFRGRGRIYLQTRNSSEYGSRVGRLLPARES